MNVVKGARKNALRLLLCAGVAIFAMREIACSVEVNPQPLPPGSRGPENNPPSDDDDLGAGGKNPSVPSADAGVENQGDAGKSDGGPCVDGGDGGLTATCIEDDAGDAG